MEICIKVFFLLPSKKEMFAYNSPFRIFSVLTTNMHRWCVSKLVGRVRRCDKHHDLRASVQMRWDTKGNRLGPEQWVCVGRAEGGERGKKHLGWPLSAVWSTLYCLMEGLITGRAHSPYHTCPLSAPHWIIPEGRICTPSIIYYYHKDPSLL